MAIAGDEGLLIRRAVAGDEIAFATLVDRHRSIIFRTALMALHDPAAADEVTQDVFVRLFQSLGSFRHDSALATWLYRITTNICMDVLRKRSRQRTHVAIDEAFPQITTADAPDARALAECDQRTVRGAVARLPLDLRAVVALRYGGGLSYAAIADALQCPLGTVCARLHRAMKLLARDLGAGPEGEAV